jgi:RNA polymerase sigma-70 factor (ECF subfamily)
MMASHSQQTDLAKRPSFDNTRWTIVLAAGEGDSSQADKALDVLCHTYWYPLYAFVRRRGYDAHDAQDLTQEFFARLLSKGYLRSVDRNKGKFRSFLLASLEHFLANDWRRSHAQKRGGLNSFIAWDEESPEHHYAQLGASGLSPNELFEQQWALALLEQVLSRLQTEFTDASKGALFEKLKIFLTGEKQDVSYRELARALSTTEAALKMTVSRMRRRYGELLREEVANTVSDPEAIEGELQALFAALSL